METQNDIFEVVRQLPVSEREAYLQEACSDTAQRERVEVLLRDAAEADAFFETGADAPTAPLGAPPVAVLNEKAGDVIGPYTLRQRLGEGGFGVVWMAEQRVPISRMVALKVVKAGMDTKQVLARFAAERQALAMMDHPNIAHVLDAGATDSGRPYFAMELVKGIPITQFCDEAGLGTRERLALFGDVCSAINHAHQKGIIHRDIKPSNVMITLYADKPVVKVIDFGIAKATQGKLTDQTLFTRFEQFLGTPVYMSPEQAALSAVDIDTRSDIYALGILLYELLTGRPPFDPETLVSAGYDEMRRIIREVEPPRPSSRLSTVAAEERTMLAKARRIEPANVDSLIEPDLDWIVMKAIEKDRTRRYETANSLAQDIARFLADEPVTATPPSTLYRVRKAWRRNRLAYTAGASVALALVIGLVASILALLGQIRARNAERDGIAVQQRADLQTARAEATAAVVSGMLRDAVPELLRQENRTGIRVLLDSADQMASSHLQGSPIAEFTVREALREQYQHDGMMQLEAAGEQIVRMEELLPQLTDEDLPPSERRRFRSLAAWRHAAGDDFERGTRDLQTLRQELKALSPPPVDLIVETLVMESDANILHGDLNTAERLVRQAMDLDPDHPGDLNLTKESPPARLANVLLLQGNYAEAEMHARRALELLPADHHEDIIDISGRVVWALCGTAKFAEAEQFIQTLSRTTSSWGEPERQALELLTVHLQLAQGRWEEAADRSIEIGLRDNASSSAWRRGAIAAKAKNDPETFERFVKAGLERFNSTADTQSAYFLYEILAMHSPSLELEATADELLQRLQTSAQGWWTSILQTQIARHHLQRGRPQEAFAAIEKFSNQKDLHGVAALAHRLLVRDERHQFIRAVALAELGRKEEAREAFLRGWHRAKSFPPSGTGTSAIITSYLSMRSSRLWAADVLIAKGIDLPAEALLP